MSEQKNSDNQQQNTSSDANLTRRKITKAALTSPIIVSLSTTPVFGCSVSGFLSGNTSENHTYECGGSGCTPGFWKNNPEAWPGSINPGTCSESNNGGACKTWNYSTGTTIGSILPTSCDATALLGGYGTGDALMEILLKEISGGGSTNSQIAHYIAAILNASSSPIYGSTVAEIQEGLCKALQDDKFLIYIQILTDLNEREPCFSDANGNCEDGFVYLEAVGCIPACATGEVFDLNTLTCVPE